MNVVSHASHLQGALIYPRSDDKALCETFYLFGLPRAEQGSAAPVGAPTRPKQNAARSEETLVGSIDNRDYAKGSAVPSSDVQRRIVGVASA